MGKQGEPLFQLSSGGKVEERTVAQGEHVEYQYARVKKRAK